MTDDRKPAEFRPARALHIALARLLENDIYLWMTREEFVVELTEATKGAVRQETIMAMYDGLMKEAGVEPMLSESDKKHDAQTVKIERDTAWLDEAEKMWGKLKPRKTIEEKLEEFRK